MGKEIDIKELRKSLNMTQKEFSEFCGVTERTVQKWEAGNTIPQLVHKFFQYVNNEFISGSTINNEGSNSIVGNGLVGNQINGCDEIISKALNEISEQRKLTEKAQEHISQLTTAILKLTDR